jgi:lysophospholipase L1-like esterase
MTWISSSSTDPGDAYGNTGFLERGVFAGGFPYVTFARASDRLAYWVGATGRDYSRLQQLAATGASTVIIALGINDTSTGATAAATEGYMTTLISQIHALGISNVIITTLTPYATSTDDYATTTNQTTNVDNSVRVAYNDYVRTNYATMGASSYYEIADTIESARDSGLWAVNGTRFYNISDSAGLHPLPAGHIRMAAAIIAGQIH